MASTEQRADQRTVDFSVSRMPQGQKLIVCLLLALATIAFYDPITHAPFLNVDDGAYVTDNPQVRAGISWHFVAWAFRSTEATNWHPVTWISHALDCQIFGLNPAGPHTINILLHAANAVLLFLILESATGLPWRSLAVAALFALHPINVESVAWISERKNVLSMFFFLVALAAYGWYVRRPGVERYLAVTLAYSLGLMTKPQVITFPFVLLLLDYWPLGRLAWPHQDVGEPAGSPVGRSLFSLMVEKVPWFALSAVNAVITMNVQAGATQMKLSPWIRLENAAISYVKYLWKAVWPVNLAPVYPHPLLSTRFSTAALSAIAIIAITVLVVRFHENGPFLVGWFWFLGTLVPMIGLVQVGVQSMADRYAYIPLLGIFVILSWGAADLIRYWHVPMALGALGTGAILLACGSALHRQINFWGDNVTLWTHTLELTEGNYAAEDNLATALIVEGRIEEAMPHVRRARMFCPDDALAALNLATYEQWHGNYTAALEGFAQTLHFSKEPALRATTEINSGYAHLSLKQYENAKQDFEAALKERPENWAGYRGRGLAEQMGGDMAGAIRDYEQAVELQPSAVGDLLLAQALEISGQAEAARAAQSDALRLSRDFNDDVATAKRLLTN